MSYGRINIGKMHQDDAHYRYTMPRLVVKVEGRGNGIKTVLVNMEEIASDLKRPVTYPTKYFGNVLGAQSKFDSKHNKAIVNGSHQAQDLQRILQEGFIQKFVLCGECTNPETVLKVDKATSDITLTCMACGHITHVDPTEKLCTFIINHPPSDQQADSAGGSKSDEEESNEQQTKANSADAAYAQSARAKDNTDIANLRTSSGFKEDDWSEDVSKEAVRRRRDAEGLAARVSEITASVDDDDSNKKKKKGSGKKKAADAAEEEQESPVLVLRDFLRKNPSVSNQDLFKTVRKLQDDYKLRDKDLVCLVSESLLLEVSRDELKTLHKSVETRAPLFSKFVDSAGESGVKILFGYLEKFAVSADNDTLKLLPVLLQKFYLEDVLSKASISKWREATKSRFVSTEDSAKIKAACKKFFEWLDDQDDDQEEEDEDEDEDEDEN